MGNPGVIIPVGVEDPINICTGTTTALEFDVDTGVAGVTVSTGTVDIYIPGTDRVFVDGASVTVTAGVTISYTLSLVTTAALDVPGMYEIRFDLMLSNSEKKCVPFRLQISSFA